MRTGEMYPGRAMNKCTSPQNKMSLLEREVVGRSPGFPGTEKMLVSLEVGQKWQGDFHSEVPAGPHFAGPQRARDFIPHTTRSH